MKPNELTQEIARLQAKMNSLNTTKQEASEALELHLKQLQKLGATLEDSVCMILRRLIEQNELQEQINETRRQGEKQMHDLWDNRPEI